MTDDDKEKTDSGARTLNIEERSAALGIQTPQMTANERARFWLAKWVLLAGALLMLAAWGIQFSVAMWGIPDLGDCQNVGDPTQACGSMLAIFNARTEAASSIFEFAKTWIPPVITLVLGYYFARENSDSDDSVDQ